ncbi:hypothetical protein TSTA_081090 [Talaromyces stipitatus ATCC 10500]|uniref:Uncharacterized protein n=1 Tax=Talaromyces stipitatus (strain ATCC 10500 / CBS 375.48 / QM 6759 / NRRL 1006) TaxID=441959 RepID=B8LZU4_TALSN|nr:uncharacterized protein TSTA_081090 [Talaromyces stipitatus ATCC 10500]EED20876.1 hypothetical protein TSTA_081090 [Talaromyces stipitatus ATCC 10500]
MDRTSGSRADFKECTDGALNLRDSMDYLDKTHGRQFPGDRFSKSLRKNRECFGCRLQSVLIRDLPPAPKSHREVGNHPLGWLFEEAEKAHLKSYDPSDSWTTVPIGKARGKQILDCMWVYVYKQDKKGRLVKCKRDSW